MSVRRYRIVVIIKIDDKGFVFVLPAGCGIQRAVDAWVRRALAFVATLPPKK